MSGWEAAAPRIAEQLIAASRLQQQRQQQQAKIKTQRGLRNERRGQPEACAVGHHKNIMARPAKTNKSCNWWNFSKELQPLTERGPELGRGE